MAFDIPQSKSFLEDHLVVFDNGDGDAGHSELLSLLFNFLFDLCELLCQFRWLGISGGELVLRDRQGRSNVNGDERQGEQDAKTPSSTPVDDSCWHRNYFGAGRNTAAGIRVLNFTSCTLTTMRPISSPCVTAVNETISPSTFR